MASWLLNSWWSIFKSKLVVISFFIFITGLEWWILRKVVTYKYQEYLRKLMFNTCTIYKVIFAPVFFFSPLSPLLSGGKFKTGQISMSHIYLSLLKHNCVLANLSWGKSHCKGRRAKITRGRKYPCIQNMFLLYSNWRCRLVNGRWPFLLVLCHLIDARILDVVQGFLPESQMFFEVLYKSAMTTNRDTVGHDILNTDISTTWICRSDL